MLLYSLHHKHRHCTLFNVYLLTVSYTKLGVSLTKFIEIRLLALSLSNITIIIPYPSTITLYSPTPAQI